MAIRQLDLAGEDYDDCWSVLEREHARYERLARRMANAKGRPDLFNELMSEVYDKAPQVAETYDPTVGTLAAHMQGSLQLYMLKFINKRERIVAREGAELDHVNGHAEDSAPSQRRDDQAMRSRDIVESSDMVVFLRDRLARVDYWLLEARHIKGYTYEVMADLLPELLGGPLSVGAARKAYAIALHNARVILIPDA